jgi:hypothetical protein
MARAIEKEGTGKHNQENAFISERAKDLAIMYLTRRKDLDVKCPANGENWVDCTVEITGRERPSRRVFGLDLRGAMFPVTTDHANRALTVPKNVNAARLPFSCGTLIFHDAEQCRSFRLDC